LYCGRAIGCAFRVQCRTRKRLESVPAATTEAHMISSNLQDGQGRRGCCAVCMQRKSKGAQLAVRAAVDCEDAGSRLSEGLIHQKNSYNF